MIACRNCERLRTETFNLKNILGILTMQFDELWDIIVEKNENLKNDKEVRMTVEGFKKAIRVAYEQGHKEGHEVASNDKSVFENIFGKRGF
jgi:hypothetical protein